MVKIAYIEKGFSSKSMVLINKANEILAANRPSAAIGQVPCPGAERLHTAE